MAKTREGDGGSPYTKPPKPHPGPFVPAPNPKKLAKNKNNLMIASDANIESMHYPTEKGFFLDGTGKAYMQTGGKFYDAGEYDVDIHGLPVPLAKRKSLKIGTA